MYLKSLTLKGFKSFADRSVLSMEPGVTAIVGPNGSGKSNISDAVLWVLGERNAKNLRGQVMEDVIFAGSSARKSVGVAEVELVLDNSDGALPIDYSEVSIGRRMYRNGESEYLINGSQARRLDVLDILHDSGLGTGTYSIISQGNLDSILQSKPQDRRALIEEAAGTLKYKQRKAKSEHRIELMDQNVSRIKDVVAEISRQLGPLERKAKRAVAYKDLSAQLNDMSLQLAVDDVRILQVKWDELCAKEQQTGESLEQKRTLIQEAQNTSNAFQERMRGGSDDVAQLARKHNIVSSYADKFDSLSLVYQEKLRQAKLRSAEIDASFVDNQQREGALSAEMQDLKQQLEELNEKLDAAKQKLDSAQSAHLLASKTLSELERDVFEQTSARRGAENAEQQVRLSHAKMTEQLALATSKSELWQERLDAAKERAGVAKQSASESEAALTKAKTSLEELLKTYEEAKLAYKSAKENRDIVSRSLQELENRDRDLRGKIAAAEEIERQTLAAQSPAAAWASKEGKLHLESLVHLLDVDEGYEFLVETLLGNSVTLLVAQDFEQAQDVRKELNNASAQGFISLVCKQSKNINSVIATEEDALAANGELLTNHIKCPAELNAFVKSALGNVVVCADFEGALIAHNASSKQLIFATKQGEYVHFDKRLVIGSPVAQKTKGALSRAKELDVLQEQHRNLAVELQTSRESLEQASNALNVAQEKELECSKNVAREKGTVAALEKDFEQAKKRENTAVAELKDVETRSAEIAATIEKTRPELEELAHTLKASEQKVLDAKSALIEAQKAVAPARETEAKCASALADEKLSYAMLTERQTYLKRVIDARVDELHNIRNAKENASATAATQKLIISRSKPLIECIELISQACRERARGIEAKSKDAQDSSARLHEQAQEALSSLQLAREGFDKVNEQLSDLRIEKGRLEVQVEAAVSVLANDYSMPVEYALELPQLQDRNKMEADVFALKRKISNMGTINPDAASEYEELKSRYDFLAGQLNDLLSAKAALKKIDTIIDSKMRENFALTFDAANKNFKEIFSTLFPGGTGELVLVDPEDMENTGIEVIAQPRGKKITKMTLMSGGEKSLVALALLFAVYRIRTTPFYILDEVEAALDDSNLRRLIEYLNELRNTTQLIMITHQRRTMEMSDVLFGVSMQADGVTKVMSQRLEHALKMAE
jgi:chromosome segregation protein